MTDLLEQYTSALKAEHDGAVVSPEASRGRIIRGLAERNPRRRKLLSIAFPAFMILGGSTAWAAASGQLEPIITQASISLGFLPAPQNDALSEVDRKKQLSSAAGLGASQNAHNNQQSQDSDKLANSDDKMSDSLSNADKDGDSADLLGKSTSHSVHSSPETNTKNRPSAAALPRAKKASPPPAAMPTGSSQRPSQQQSALSVAATTQQPATKHKNDSSPALTASPQTSLALNTASSPTSDPRQVAALQLYQEGHRAQFQQGNCQAAIFAYERYLKQYSGESFEVEARYNRAVCLARLGQNQAASQALKAFAAGQYGGYRQQEASELLKALN